jgi:hypothetical protein
MEATQMIYFQMNGIQYRYDGKNVEALDGTKWNRTGSLNVYLAAKKLFAESSFIGPSSWGA